MDVENRWTRRRLVLIGGAGVTSWLTLAGFTEISAHENDGKEDEADPDSEVSGEAGTSAE